MPYLPPHLRAKLAQTESFDEASGAVDAISPVRQPDGPPKAAQPNESGSLGFVSPRVPRLPTQEEVVAAKASKKLRAAAAWTTLNAAAATNNGSPLGDISNGRSDESSPRKGRAKKVEKEEIAAAELDALFGATQHGTLIFFRDVMSDGKTPNPLSWSGAGSHHIGSTLTPEEHVEQWKDNELRRREKAINRAEREGIADPVQFPPIEEAAEEERRQFTLWKSVADEGSSQSKPLLLSRVMIYESRSHPLLDPSNNGDGVPKRAIQRALKFDPGRTPQRGNRAQQEDAGDTETPLDAAIEGEQQDDSLAGEGQGSSSSVFTIHPLQTDQRAGATHGEIWVHSNVDGILPLNIRQMLGKYRSKSIATRKQEWDEFTQRKTPESNGKEQDEKVDFKRLFRKPFYFTPGDKDAPNFHRPLPFYGPGNGARNRPKAGAAPGKMSFTFQGWFRLTSVKLVAPYSPEVVRMHEIKYRSKLSSDERQRNETWGKTLGHVWARVGVQRVSEPSITPPGQTEPVELVDDLSVISGGPDGLEAYLAKIGGLIASKEQPS